MTKKYLCVVEFDNDRLVNVSREDNPPRQPGDLVRIKRIENDDSAEEGWWHQLAMRHGTGLVIGGPDEKTGYVMVMWSGPRPAELIYWTSVCNLELV